MSLDKSLKKASGLARARSVLSRAERLALLQEDERWQPAAGVYNLPKTKYRRWRRGSPGQNVRKRTLDRSLASPLAPHQRDRRPPRATSGGLARNRPRGCVCRYWLETGVVSQRSVGISLISAMSEKSRSVRPPTSWVDISIRTLR